MRFTLTLLAFAFLLCITSCNKYKGLEKDEIAETIVEDIVDDKQIVGAILSISSPDFEWTGAHGNLNADDAYFIASTTKLFTTTVIYQLVDEGQLSLDDKLSKHLSANILDGLHVCNGDDHTDQITVKHLLSNTSGLPDYFEGKNDEGEVLSKELMKGNDDAWTFEEAIARAKTMEAAFEPGKKGKALYSDTNFQLLGKIIEELTGLSVAEAYQERIVTPLGLEHTYSYTDPEDDTPAPLRYKREQLDIPKAMTSFQADGSVVSTAEESMIFCKAFFNGELFNAQHIEDAQVWNKIFYPNDYGVGMMRYELPGFYGIPTFIGHSGLSGAFVWYCPEKELFVSGTVNQINKPGTSYRMLARVVTALDQ